MSPAALIISTTMPDGSGALPASFEQFFFPSTSGGSIRNLVIIGSVVSEEKLFEIVDGRQTTEPAYTRSPGAFSSGELKKYIY